jgi:hypothetical protein
MPRKKLPPWCAAKDERGWFCTYRKHTGPHRFGCAAGRDGECFHPLCPQANAATRKSWCGRATNDQEED